MQKIIRLTLRFRLLEKPRKSFGANLFVGGAISGSYDSDSVCYFTEKWTYYTFSKGSLEVSLPTSVYDSSASEPFGFKVSGIARIIGKARKRSGVVNL
jgi:hypothetical protein